MSPNPVPLRRMWAASVLPRRSARLERRRIVLGDGQRTTLHIASYDRAAFTARVVVLGQPAPLARWCQVRGVRNALVGGFFLRSQYAPLGELRIDGELVPSVPFDEPWGAVRACLQI